MSTMERWKGKQEAAEDILGGFQRALDFCTWLWIAWILADCLKLMTMLENLRASTRLLRTFLLMFGELSILWTLLLLAFKPADWRKRITRIQRWKCSGVKMWWSD